MLRAGRCHLFWVGAIVASLPFGYRPHTGLAQTADPTTQAAPPDERFVNELTKRLGQLTDKDPTVRAAARESLMSLHSSDLTALRRAVRSCDTDAPGLSESLYGIVEQVFLSGEDVPVDPTTGFMGISMGIGETGEDFEIHMEEDSDPDATAGVVVTDRIPGFSAFRALQNGDLILAVVRPDAEPRRVRINLDVSEAIRGAEPGQTVKLILLRNGKRTDVSIVLNARPAAFTLQGHEEAKQFRDDRKHRAAEYWRNNFADLVHRQTT